MDDAFTITCVHSAPAELATAAQLLALLSDHDLTRWRFTTTIQIDQRAIPHSHPVLTLHTRHLDDDGLLLSTYLHEHLHWFVADRAAAMDEAIAALRRRYPHAPVGYPDGSKDERGSYAHYVICYLEWRAVLEVLGAADAARIFAFWRGDHYRAIYAAVLDDAEAIGTIVTTRVGLP